jgi:diacylglycerol O-acyltransferase / wax synthase
MRRMGGQDAAFLYGETPSWHMHISALMILDPSTSPVPFDFERVRLQTIERLPRVPQFRLKLVEVPLGLDRPGWVEEPDFDVDYHIRRIAVPGPGGARELGELVGRLASYKLDRRKPLWELWVIEGLEGGRLAVLYKIHHAMIDGVSGMGLAEVSFDLEADPPLQHHEPVPFDDHNIPGWPQRLAFGLVNAATRAPYRTARFAWQSARQSLTLMDFARRRRQVVAPFQAPRTSLNGEFTPHRRFAWVSVPLPRVKAVKHAYDVKLNDVVLALCAGALRRYLQKIDDLPAQPLIAQCPVSLRTGMDQDVGSVGSKVGSMFTSLATDIAEPADRLLAIKESTSQAKQIGQALSADKIMGLTESTPPGLISLAARMYTAMGLETRMPPPINVVISNVPGPPFPLYLAGARLEAMYPMGPLLLGTGLNITVISYCDSIDFGFLCCPEMVPEPAAIAEGIPIALEELEASVGLGETARP